MCQFPCGAKARLDNQFAQMNPTWLRLIDLCYGLAECGLPVVPSLTSAHGESCVAVPQWILRGELENSSCLQISSVLTIATVC